MIIAAPISGAFTAVLDRAVKKIAETRDERILAFEKPSHDVGLHQLHPAGCEHIRMDDHMVELEHISGANERGEAPHGRIRLTEETPVDTPMLEAGWQCG